MGVAADLVRCAACVEHVVDFDQRQQRGVLIQGLGTQIEPGEDRPAAEVSVFVDVIDRRGRSTADDDGRLILLTDYVRGDRAEQTVDSDFVWKVDVDGQRKGAAVVDDAW